jgi:predicted transglutaminase-like cysteine proteinase
LPREALLVTVVRDKRDEGHAVLTVITDKGDYVLDNQSKDILLWSETGYSFVKRQSQSNPNGSNKNLHASKQREARHRQLHRAHAT